MYRLNEKDKLNFDFENPESSASEFLDIDSLFKDGEYTKNDDWKWSRDNRYIAYPVLRNGSDWKSYRIYDTQEKKPLEDQLTKIKFSGPNWDIDSKGFYYGRYDSSSLKYQGNDPQELPHMRVYYHKVGQSQDEDQFIYENPAKPKLSHSISKTEDGLYLKMSSSSGAENFNHVSIAKVGENAPEFKPLFPGKKGEFIYIYNIGSKFFYLTNYKAPYKKVFSVDVNFPQEENWKVLLSGDESNYITGADFTNHKLVIKFSNEGAESIKIYDMTSHEERAQVVHEVKLPGRGQIEDEFGGNYDENFYLFSY